jgi:hypothetical protein
MEVCRSVSNFAFSALASTVEGIGVFHAFQNYQVAMLLELSLALPRPFLTTLPFSNRFSQSLAKGRDSINLKIP